MYRCRQLVYHTVPIARVARGASSTVRESAIPTTDLASPLTLHGRSLAAHRAPLLALQRSAGNCAVQRLLAPLIIQRANAADRRLPADKAEALANAAAAKAEIDTVAGALATASDAVKRNTGELIASKKLKPMVLTPRHDSVVGAPAIRFFPGKNDYSGSFTADAETTHRVSRSKKGLWVRARKHDDVDTMLPAADIEARLVAAVSEVAHLDAAGPGTPKLFDRYRARFNAFYGLPPFNAMSAEAKRTDTSKGPKSDRARAIFERLYNEDAEIKSAYDANKKGIRELIDTYTGPEGMNRINSPRLQALRAAFFKFKAPVSAAKLPAFTKAITGPAAALDAEDRAAFERSNDWQRLIDDHIKDETERQTIRDLIMGNAGASAGADPRLPAFLKDWLMAVGFLGPTGFEKVKDGAVIQYRYGLQRVRVEGQLPSGQTNPGLRLFVRGTAAGPTPLAGADKPWPIRQDRAVALSTGFRAPAAVAAAGDKVKLELKLLDTNKTDVLDTKSIEVTIKAETGFTEAQVKAAAKEDADFFAPGTAGGLLEKMKKLGGTAANVAASIELGKLKLRPMTVRHDSDSYVREGGRTPGPIDAAWFFGADYGPFPDANTSIEPAGIGGLSLGGAAGDIVVNRTTDAATNKKHSDDTVIDIVVHEGIHGLDFSPVDPHSTLEAYKAEFRAYWMMGKYGPPDTATCPKGDAKCKPAIYDESMIPPGPKSPRARAIFDHVYNSPAYAHLKAAYDSDGAGFRQFADSYLVPDGINLTVSPRTDDLRLLIDGWDGKDFPAFKSEVNRFLGIGAPPTNGVLTADDRAEIVRSRSWRDLVELKVKKKAQQIEIKTMLGIPL